MVLSIFKLSHQIKINPYIYIYIYGETFRLPVADSMLKNYSSRIQSRYYPQSFATFLCLLQLCTGACPDPHKSSLLPHALFKALFNINFLSINENRESYLSCRFSTVTFVSSHCCIMSTSSGSYISVQ